MGPRLQRPVAHTHPGTQRLHAESRMETGSGSKGAHANPGAGVRGVSPVPVQVEGASSAASAAGIHGLEGARTSGNDGRCTAMTIAMPGSGAAHAHRAVQAGYGAVLHAKYTCTHAHRDCTTQTQRTENITGTRWHAGNSNAPFTPCAGASSSMGHTCTTARAYANQPVCVRATLLTAPER